jgi:NADH:ubiquinone oxidoreductase subunit 4 (subunit M)
MNIILFLTICYPVKDSVIISLFLLMHGLLSTLMFFVVDLLQKQYQTRNIGELSGAIIHNKSLLLIC